MSLAEQADAATTRDALAATARLTDPTKETPVTTDRPVTHELWGRKWHEGELLTPDEITERLERQSVTVTLPRDVVVARTTGLWRETAANMRHLRERKAAALLDALADALDAANRSQS